MGGFRRYISDAMVVDMPHTKSGCVTQSAVAPDIELLVREHSRLVFRIAYSVVRNHADAEDVVQEVFLRIARHGTRGIVDAKAWISRIAWRAAVDRSRSPGGREQEEFDELIHAPAAHRPGAEQQAISREALELLDRLISALPAKERDALLLTSIEEMTSAEAAAVLGTTETSVRARVFRARQKLLEKLQKGMGTNHGR